MTVGPITSLVNCGGSDGRRYRVQGQGDQPRMQHPNPRLPEPVAGPRLGSWWRRARCTTAPLTVPTCRRCPVRWACLAEALELADGAPVLRGGVDGTGRVRLLDAAGGDWRVALADAYVLEQRAPLRTQQVRRAAWRRRRDQHVHAPGEVAA